MDNNSSFNYRNASPVTQGIVVLALLMLFNLFTLAGGTGEGDLFKPVVYWVNTIAFILVYSLFGSVLSLFAEDQNKYWGQSMGVYAAICIIGGLLAWAFSGLTIDEAGSFRWLYGVFTFGFILLLTIVRMIRKIVIMAQKQDKRLRGEK